MTPNDFGPIYRETNLAHFPVEPFNTYSNLIFLLIFFYWSYKIKYDYKRFPFLTFCLPILFIGYIGGTVYHATRSHSFWLVMDFLPIYILCLSLSFKFWLHFLKGPKKVFLFTIFPYLIIRQLLWLTPLERNTKISIGYLLLASMVAAPLIKYAIENRRRYNRFLYGAFVSFLLAITFRVGDKSFPLTFEQIFPMGTHWLWHLMGGVATNFLILYLYEMHLEAQGNPKEAVLSS